MQECTPEIITKSAERARFDYKQISKNVQAFIISNPQNKKSFIAAPWMIYPNQQQWHAGIMKYKDLSAHFLGQNNFKIIPGNFLYTDEYDGSELYKRLLDSIEVIGGFPCVIKPNNGSTSKFVYIIQNEIDLNSHIIEIKENIPELLVQKYIQEDEYRLFIYLGKILFLYKKTFISNTAITTRDLGAPDDISYMMKQNFPDYLNEYAQKLYSLTSAEIIGADVFIKENIKTRQEITTIELNHNPGLGVMYETYNEQEFILNFLSGVYQEYLS